MNKSIKIAITEYLNAVRSKGFIIGIILLPVLMFGSIGVQYLTRDKVDLNDRKVAVVDPTGKLYSVLESKAQKRNSEEIMDQKSDPPRQMRPKFLVSLHEPAAGERTDLVLSEKIRKKELFAFLMIDPVLLEKNNPAEPGLLYFTETPSYQDLPNWLNQILEKHLQEQRANKLGIDPKVVAAITTPVFIKKLGLVKVGPDGQVKDARQENPIATFGLPFGVILMMFMLVMTSAPAMLHVVLEEKMQKIAELLVSSVSPFQLMLGKLIGLVMVSLTLSFLYLGAAAFSLYKMGNLEVVPPTLFAWFFLFQVLALLMYGSIFLAIGAACTELKDAQNLMGPAMLLMMIPMFTLGSILQSPNSSFATGVSFFPTATPMILLMRIAIAPGPPAWQIITGLVICIGFTLFSLWAGAKIFRIGILGQGQPPTIGKLIRWLFAK